MKLDKETAIKHHFWGLLGLAVPMVLVCLLVLLTAVSAEIRRHRKALEDAHKSVENSSGVFKNDDWVKAMQRAAGKKKEEEKEVWEKAYEAQAHLFTWPVEFESAVHFQDGFFPVSIKVYRKPPAETFIKNDAKLPQYRLRGKIVSANADKFEVAHERKEGKKLIRLPQVTFYRTPEITNKASKKILTDDNKELNFFDLRDDDWVDVTYEIGKYFGDPMTEVEQRKYSDTYASQLEGILAQVQPVSANGSGVVQLRGWFHKADEKPLANAPFFRFVSKEWDLATNISDEAWIAQEDLWIQRELYRLVRLANDYVSIFKKKDGGDSDQWHTFLNPYWQLDLKLAGPNKLDLKITNLLPRRQKLDIAFKVRVHDPKSDEESIVIKVGGRDPLNPNETYRPANGYDLKPKTAPTGIYGVEQLINWETAAVKRIDHISIGSMSDNDCCHSDRTMVAGLQPFKAAPKKAAVVSGPGGKPGGGVLDGGAFKKDGDDRGGAVTRHGLHAVRYSAVTTQSRQLPVGLALIVDQDHIDRVLLAFTNSPLRFLTTQVIVNRYPRSLRPSLNQVAGRGAGGGDGDMGGQRPGAAPIGGGGGGGFPPGGNRPERAVATGESSESNMELVIYGIVTLYERYPPRKGN